MSVTMQGESEVIRALEAKLGTAKTNRVVNKALRAAGERNQKIVKEAVSSYMDTGETYDLVVTSGIRRNPKRVETGWASKTRAPLVHLNEFGYTRFGKYVRPRGMGKLRAAADEIKATSFTDMKKDLKELVE